MDINTLRVISVVLGSIAFLGVCWWAFSPKRKKRFEEDAKLPFADEEEQPGSADRKEETGGSAVKQNKGQEEK
ncbi:cbb3-type cytochrome oxidase subunit 3 [Microbulbifer hainanensis]|uniref:cbb3-type cytochrome oxidase subunit 3 n=1 Tax=Microbulbifer hainanensis TaxID=2735675 RepID=UPI001865B5BF|nr:cbb3-type cytochrome c oxidase subunit 3 [Microbulbifer hainanensis]